MTVAPHGDVAIVPCSPWTAPSTWERYRQGYFRAWSAGSVFPMYLVIDLGTGSARRLSGAPWDYSSATLVWAPDGQSVVVANDMLPLDVPDSVERMARATHKMVAEIDVHTGAITTIAHRDSLNVVSWDPRSATIELVPGARFGSNETVRLYYRKTVAGWVAASAAHIRATARVPTLVIDQGMNAPGRLVAVDPRTNGRYVVYDPNPGLMAAYRFAHEDAVHWRTKAGATWVGGLYWPLDYLKGHRYPLLIQTHGFDSTSFWPDVVYATGEAAQPLAGRGVMVLQMPMPPDDQWMTPREALLAQEGAEGAIDYLDSLGLIDRTQIGMQGFSRTSFYTLYFLTHSHYLIAAATVADGVDMGYLQNLVFQPMWIGLGQNEDVRINGG